MHKEICSSETGGYTGRIGSKEQEGVCGCTRQCSHRGMLLCHVDLRELMPGPLTTIKTRFYET